MYFGYAIAEGEVSFSAMFVELNFNEPVILYVRAYAVWGRARTILYFLTGTFLVSIFCRILSRHSHELFQALISAATFLTSRFLNAAISK